MTATIIDFNQFRRQRELPQTSVGYPGFLIWLHCPSCNLVQYTTVQMHGGRVHKCGTLVDEVEVPIDVRCEYTLSLRNLTILKNWEALHLASFADNRKLRNYLESSLRQMEVNEIEFQKRLVSVLPSKLEPHPETWSPQEYCLELKTIEPFGILLSSARQSERYFPNE